MDMEHAFVICSLFSMRHMAPRVAADHLEPIGPMSLELLREL
jgi:hypothetical protein